MRPENILKSVRFGCAAAILAFAGAPAFGQADEPVSQCLAIAQSAPNIQLATFTPVALQRGEVQITFVGHSTFRIESADGTIVATDYAGFAGQGPVPTVVTMNQAHSSHYTPFPDPAIEHVLRGWNPEGGPAKHREVIGDFYIRNVPTDLRAGAAGPRIHGNSIFVFEVGGLCIGHLGHLHHELTPSHRAAIGRLDIVFVPVDGGYTMAQESMAEVLTDLRAQIVIPMHYFGPTTLARFVAVMDGAFAVEYRETPTLTVSLNTLPKSPTVMVLPGY